MHRLMSASLSLLVSCFALAQDRSPAESAFESYIAATRAYDTARMSSSMHPEALQRFRAVIVAALEGGKSELAQAELLPLFSVSTMQEFSRLSDVEAYKRLTDFAARSAPEVIELMANVEYEIVDTVVTDGVASVTYVLTVPVEGRKVSQEVVQKLKPNDGRWMLLLPTTAEATIAGIESRYH